jgi:hypothetical protein
VIPVWRVPWLRNFPGPIDKPWRTEELQVSALVFQLEHDGTTFQPVANWEENRYRYRCMDCYLASGSKEDSFTTGFEKAADLKTGPTNYQMDEMSDHARQHSIMWSWARSLK